MSNASRDANRVPTLLATLNSDGSTIVPVFANASNSKLKVSDGTTGSDLGPTQADRDENRVPALMAVSSVDGVTPVVVYADSNGRLLIKTT